MPPLDQLVSLTVQSPRHWPQTFSLSPATVDRVLGTGRIFVKTRRPVGPVGETDRAPGGGGGLEHPLLLGDERASALLSGLGGARDDASSTLGAEGGGEETGGGGGEGGLLLAQVLLKLELPTPPAGLQADMHGLLLLSALHSSVRSDPAGGPGAGARGGQQQQQHGAALGSSQRVSLAATGSPYLHGDFMVELLLKVLSHILSLLWPPRALLGHTPPFL
jgi:hypothetical protein